MSKEHKKVARLANLQHSEKESAQVHSPSQSELSMDEIEQLYNLTLLPGGLSIHDEQNNKIDVINYIIPTDLVDKEEGIGTERLEIAMLQLQHRASSQLTDLNNLACVLALLGRYKEAESKCEEAEHLLVHNSPDEIKLTIKANQNIIKQIEDDRNTQRYWGEIGGSQ